MRALFGGGGGPVHWRDIPEPRIEGSLDLLVRPLAIALCDLDVPYITNLLPTGDPYPIGHEFTGEVVAIGDGVRQFAPGDRVMVPFQISCGGCDRCRAGRSLDCQSVPPLSTFGLAPFGGGDWGGAAATRIRVPFGDAMCLALPEDADPVAMAGFSDNVVDGYRSVAPHVRPGDAVIVFGSASVGLYATATAAALGAPCTYVDFDRDRLTLAEKLGANVVETFPDGRTFGEFPVSVACISTAGGLVSAIRSTAPGGICQSSGIHFFPVEPPLYDMYRRGIRLFTGRASARDDMPAALSLVAQGRFPVEMITSQVVDLDDAVAALAEPLPHKTVLRAS